MRRTLLLLTLMATATLLASGIALAINKVNCPNRPDNLFGNVCMGTRVPDVMTGTVEADDMRGLAGDDTIRAAAENDLLLGGGGNDQLMGHAGNDRYVFTEGWGNDTIALDTSGQLDTVMFRDVSARVKIALDDQHPSITRGASSGQNKVTFSANFIENAWGGSGSDVIAGSSANNSLVGNDGVDSLEGAGGNDYLDGGPEADTLEGGHGDDKYQESSGRDALDDASGLADRLNLAEHSSSEATFTPLDGSDAGNNYEDLSIDVGGGNIVLIKNYFDNSAPKVKTSGAGTGLIENIRFSDGTFHFGDVQSLMRDPVVATDDSATTTEDTAKVIDVLANDSDPNLSVKAASLGDPAHGTATLITEDGPDKGKVSYNPDLNYNNTAQSRDTFTYEACDNLIPPLCDEATVSVRVNPVNDKPSFTSQGDQSVAEDSGPQTVTGWASFDPGPANESSQQVADYIVTDENGAALNSNLFTQNGQPDVSNNGTLSYTPAPETSGSIAVKVVVKDNGGTASGGVDTSDTQTFNMSITPENDPPTISNISNQTIDEDGNTGALSFTIGDVESAVGDLTLSGSSSITTLVPNASIVIGPTSPTDGNRTVTVTPAPNKSGTATIEVKVEHPDGGSATEAFLLTVHPVNDAPVADDETFDGNSSAVGNTALIGNDPSDGAPTVNGPKKTILSADILDGDTDVDGPGPLEVVAGTFATNHAGSVTIESDGDFTFTPAADTSCTVTSEFFNYTLTDKNPGTAGTDTGKVDISISGCVWYVSNNHTGSPDNLGTSNAPFNTLAQAQSASGTGHSIFVFDGDNTTTGYSAGIDLKANQKLMGEAATLTVGSDTLHTGDSTKRPTLTDNNADVVALDAANEVGGLELDPQGTGGGIAGAAGDTGGGTIDDVRIIDNGTAGTQPGLELDATTGTFNVSNLTVSTNGATGVRLNNAGTLNVTGASNTIDSTSATALNVTNTDIGADGANFQRISSGNDTAAADPANGIVLNNTGSSGGLTVTGNGNTSQGGDNSGGTIQNTTGDGVSLTNTVRGSRQLKAKR